MEIGELISIVNIHKLKPCDVLHDIYKGTNIMLLSIKQGTFTYLDETGEIVNGQIGDELDLDDRYRYLCNASNNTASSISKIKLKCTYALAFEED